MQFLCGINTGDVMSMCIIYHILSYFVDYRRTSDSIADISPERNLIYHQCKNDQSIRKVTM